MFLKNPSVVHVVQHATCFTFFLTLWPLVLVSTVPEVKLSENLMAGINTDFHIDCVYFYSFPWGL